MKLTNVAVEGVGKIKGEATVGGIQAILTDSGEFFCPFTGNTTVENATYTGNLTVSHDGFAMHVG